MASKRKFKTWDQYVKEASKPPFPLGVKGDKVIDIKVPNGQQMIDSQRAGEDIEKQLVLLCGDSADDVLELVRVAPAGAALALIKDVTEYFDISGAGGDEGESPAS